MVPGAQANAINDPTLAAIAVRPLDLIERGLALDPRKEYVRQQSKRKIVTNGFLSLKSLTTPWALIARPFIFVLLISASSFGIR